MKVRLFTMFGYVAEGIHVLPRYAEISPNYGGLSFKVLNTFPTFSTKGFPMKTEFSPRQMRPIKARVEIYAWDQGGLLTTAPEKTGSQFIDLVMSIWAECPYGCTVIKNLEKVLPYADKINQASFEMSTEGFQDISR